MSSSVIVQSCSYGYLKLSVDRSIKALGPLKKIDLYQPARIDLSIGIEKIMETLVSFVKEGKFDHIGLSECNADTLRKAHSVSTSSIVFFKNQNAHFHYSAVIPDLPNQCRRNRS
jgi:aryl-alcohol dehydrogenase-like predicted oxidoreductase